MNHRGHGAHRGTQGKRFLQKIAKTQREKYKALNRSSGMQTQDEDMPAEVVITRGGVTITFCEAKRSLTGWLESYDVKLAANGLSAVVHVENPPYGTAPNDFFRDLAKHWKGWKGEKGWRAMESELDLTAIADSCGHITITADIHPDEFPLSWSSRVSLVIDAGQLEGLNREFDEFFR